MKYSSVLCIVDVTTYKTTQFFFQNLVTNVSQPSCVMNCIQSIFAYFLKVTGYHDFVGAYFVMLIMGALRSKKCFTVSRIVIRI